MKQDSPQISNYRTRARRTWRLSPLFSLHCVSTPAHSGPDPYLMDPVSPSRQAPMAHLLAWLLFSSRDSNKVLVRAWRNENPCALLEGIQNGAAT